MLVEELSTEDFQNSDTDVFLVKLTDSCMKCLEKVAAEDPDTCKLQLDSRDGSSGSLSISIGNEKKKFDFAASEMHMDPKGSYDCIRRLSRDGFCQALASMRTKLTIQANDDVYSATREKIAIAEENAKKNHAKEIKTGSSRSKFVKRVIRNATAPQSGSRHGGSKSRECPVKIVPPILRQSAALDKAEAAKKAALAGANSGKSKAEDRTGIFSDLTLRERVVHLLALKAYTEPEILLRLKQDGLSEADKGKLHHILCAVGQPNRQNKFLLLPKLFEEVRLDWPAYSDEDRSLLKTRRAMALRITDSSSNKKGDKERAFQQSSARRQTRPAPIAGSGSAVPTEKKLAAIAQVGDRREDEEVLRQVGLKYCVSKDTLGRWLINEELLLNKRANELGVSRQQLPQHLTQPVQSTTPAAGLTLAPATTISIASVPTPIRTSPKRPALPGEDGEPCTAKRTCPRLPSPISDVSPTSSGCRASPNSPPPSGSASSCGGGTGDRPGSGGGGDSAPWPPAKEVTPEPPTRPPAKPQRTDFDDLTSEKATADLLREYPPIKSDFQKTKYKQDFHHDYKEYTFLYCFVNDSIEKLKQLDVELNSYPVDSAGYERVGQKVLQAMKGLHAKGDPVRMRQRLEHLDAKLSHIKRQVSVYNRNHRPTFSS